MENTIKDTTPLTEKKSLKEKITSPGNCPFHQSYSSVQHLKDGHGDFPSSPVVKTPPCNAEYMGSVPHQGSKNPHALEHLSSCAASIEPTCHN